MQFAYLDGLHDEWQGEGIEVVAIGVNPIGQEPYVSRMIDGVSLPLLQDELGTNVMRQYELVDNDLVILDSDGLVWKKVWAADLSYNLATRAGRDSLKRWVREVE